MWNSFWKTWASCPPSCVFHGVWVHQGLCNYTSEKAPLVLNGIWGPKILKKKQGGYKILRKNSRFLTLKWQIWERTLSLQCLRRLSWFQSFKPWGLNALIICWIASWCTTTPQDINCAVVLHTQAVTSFKSVCFLLNSSSRQRLFEAQTLLKMWWFWT